MAKDASSSAESAGSRPRAPKRKRPAGWRKWAVRAAAVVLAPLVAVAVLEGVLRLVGYGHPAEFFVKVEGRGAYTNNGRFMLRFFPPMASRPVRPLDLPTTKAPGTIRIFVFGGSAAYGTPDPAFSFARILEVMLSERFPATRFEVVNTAAPAINSHVILPIARECAELEPDVFVVYMGNNEVVGPYGAGAAFGAFSPDLGAIRGSIWLRGMKVGQLLRDVGDALVGGPRSIREWGGMEIFLENRVAAVDGRLAKVRDHFRRNLLDLCRAAAGAGAKTVLCTVATNLKDYPPAVSMHRDGLTGEPLRRWERLRAKGVASEAAGRHAAAGSYRAAAEIDDQFAELFFRLGRCELAAGRAAEARAAFARARDLDALRFRCDGPLDRVIREVAAEQGPGVRLVDVERSLQADGPPGRELFWDHAHLNFAGNFLVAAEVFRAVVASLPESIRAAGPIQPPDRARCAELLALTEADRYQMAAAIAATMDRPPFTGQADHEARSARRRRELAALRPGVSSAGLAAAVAAKRQALERRTEDAVLRHNLAQLYMTQKNHAAAARQFRRLTERWPDRHPDLHHRRAEALFRQGKLDEAIEQWWAAVKIDADYEPARMALGAALIRTGALDAAAEQFTALIDTWPDHAGAHALLAEVLTRQGKGDQARRHRERAEQLRKGPAAP